MNAVILEVRPLADALRDVSKAARGKKSAAEARISFAVPELIWEVLTPNRWGVLRAMVGRGPMTVRKIAGELGRDVKAVHTDIKALTAAGILDKDEDGHAVFPFDQLQVRFDLGAAA